MSAKRVLICGFTEAKGGMESYIMEIYRHCDREQIQFDFLNFHTFELACKEEIESLGGRIFYVPMKSADYKGHYEALDKVFSETKYAGVYYQVMHKLVSLDVFKYAKKYGVPKRVMHAHTTKSSKGSLVHNLRVKLAELNLPRYVTDYFACSEEAGKWLFGNKKFQVIKNSIDTEGCRFLPNRRDEIRSELGIGKQLVVGTVGRMVEVKNPEYIMDVFAEVHKKQPESFFVHVGDGNKMERMRQKRAEYKLEDAYLLLGTKYNVADYLNAMDVFVLPSFQEGYPIVLLEAQATGLPCVVADHITRTCDLTGKMEFLSIDVPAEHWANVILGLNVEDRASGHTKIEEAGYGVQTVSKQIQNFFIA